MLLGIASLINKLVNDLIIKFFFVSKADIIISSYEFTECFNSSF